MDDLTALALAAGRGDPAATAAFVRATQADVWRLCAYLGGRDEADDLTQETYVRALPALRRYRGDAPARAWLLTIARRTAADRVRRAVRQRAAMSRLDAPEAASPDHHGGLEIAELVEALDDERREAFVLTRVLGLSYEDAAEVVGCPVGTIRSRVSRARAELVERLRDAEAPGSPDEHGEPGPLGRRSIG